MNYELLIVATALFLGGIVQSVGGFGAMLVAVPLVSLVLPIQTAVPLLAALGVPITMVVFYHNRRGIDWREVARISAGSIAGIPIGLWMLGHVDSAYTMRGLGGLLVSYSLYALVVEPRLIKGPRVAQPSRTGLSLMAGIASGTLGAAFNTGGPPLIIYGDWLRWPKERFKALLQGVFLANGSLIITGHILAGNYKVSMLPDAAAALPGILLGLWAGHHLDGRINADQFRRVVLGLLTVMGLSLLFR